VDVRIFVVLCVINVEFCDVHTKDNFIVIQMIENGIRLLMRFSGTRRILNSAIRCCASPRLTPVFDPPASSNYYLPHLATSLYHALIFEFLNHLQHTQNLLARAVVKAFNVMSRLFINISTA